jgi:hypothetical protein
MTFRRQGGKEWGVGQWREGRPGDQAVCGVHALTKVYLPSTAWPGEGESSPFPDQLAALQGQRRQEMSITGRGLSRLSTLHTALVVQGVQGLGCQARTSGNRGRIWGLRLPYSWDTRTLPSTWVWVHELGMLIHLPELALLSFLISSF